MYSRTDLRTIPIERIDTPRRPVRRILGDVTALAESMQDFGLQQPIGVRSAGDRYMLTSGLRRLTAARMLGWTSISAFVRDVSADDAYVLDLIENMQRLDLTPEEEADALGELIRGRAWTTQQVADAIKRSAAYVSKRVRLFEDPLLREAVTLRAMPVSTAEELLAAPPEPRAQLIERALVERWDQATARDALRELSFEPVTPDQPSARGLHTTDDHRPADIRRRGAAATITRPRGLTRSIREFRQVLSQLRAEDLTHADRAALRALFRDLVFLARLTKTQPEHVFPPLPTVARLKRSTVAPG